MMVRLPLLFLSAIAIGSATPVTDSDVTAIQRIALHNANPNRTFDMKYSNISALTPEEYKRRLGSFMPDVIPNAPMFKKPLNFTAPDSLDWRQKGIVTHVKDQKDCGSCWAFSAVGALEGQHALKKAKLIELSEQNLVDCSSENKGCDGGWTFKAFQYVQSNGGIDTEESYPYEHKAGLIVDDTCHFKRDSVGETDEGFVSVPHGDEEALKNAVASVGPISVSIDADHTSFQNYGRVYYEPDCSSHNTDHAVLVVGYGSDGPGLDYWIVKNRIEFHNANPERTYNMSFNHISALSPEEYKKRLGFRVRDVRRNTTAFQLPENFKAPDSVDWRENGWVSHVKNQMDCGSCWAFAVVGAFEGQHAKRNGTLVEFSEQNLVDCNSENQGCNGGDPNLAYQYVKQNGGIDTEDSYPYHGKEEKCHFDKSSIGETEKNYVDLPEGDEEALKNAVASIGPISVAIDCDHPNFSSYSEGVYYEPECSSKLTELDHAVLVVGYGTDPKHGDYWLVKNSWSTGWGDKGYIKMARNRDNNCGIASYANYPIVG